jgi:hypothetical protein
VTQPAGASVVARVRGVAPDAAATFDAAVRLEQAVLRISYVADVPTLLEIPIQTLNGATFEDGTLTLHRPNAAAVTLHESAHLDGLRHRLEAAVCSFPAQTLSLRHFGSERSAPGSDHDLWFDALLAARRVAEETRTVETQRRAFEAARLMRHAQVTRAGWAAARFEDPADRRALEAELEEASAAYTGALRQLEHAALRLRQAPDDRQFSTWRRWTATVQRAFRAADDAWELMVPVLSDSRGASGSFWRRVLRRTGKRAP